MSNFDIGISGLQAAQRAIDIIGNNIANAATEGYHRQRVDFSGAYAVQDGSQLIGGGVDIEGVTRLMDSLLEQEILTQKSLLKQTESEARTIETIENAMAEFGSEQGGLNAAIDHFFNALHDLSAHPSDMIWQSQAVSNAQAMATEFRTLDQFLTNLKTNIELETQTTVSYINTLAGQIATLNDNIQRIAISGAEANNLKDQRDQQIQELAELIGLETQSRPYGVVDVTVSGIPLVSGATSMSLQAGYNDASQYGISVQSSTTYMTNIQGGKIGALLTLKNQTVADLHTNLNSLAQTIINEINAYHVQSVGPSGAFSQLTGRIMSEQTLANISDVTDGSIYIRLTNTGTGEITRHQITVDQSTDMLSTIAAKINAISGLNSSVAASKLNISADAGYTFDFSPAVLSEPTSTSFSEASPPTITLLGIYTGSTNQTLTAAVSGSGQVGNGTLQITVTDGAGQSIGTFDIGSGYAAGDTLKLDNGISIAVGVGDLADGDTFEIDVFANTDTSGLLAHAGLNTFFSGTGSSDIDVASAIVANPARIGSAIGPDMTDNKNILRMAQFKDQAVINNLTCGQFYRQMITDTAQQLSVKRLRQDNLEVMIQNLTNRQNQISGVDINEEAAQLLVFEQMFQAMAKYMTTVNMTMMSVMQII